MDLIKEVHNILVHHLGEDTPRGRRFPNEHEELKSDLGRLVSYAIQSGQYTGREEMRAQFRQNKKEFDEQLDAEQRQMIRDIKAIRPESREAKKDDE